MNIQELKTWCEENDIEFTEFTQYHWRVHDTDLDIKVDIWPTKQKFKLVAPNEHTRFYRDLQAELHQLLIVPAMAEDKVKEQPAANNISLLDYFAAKAMQGLMVSPEKYSSVMDEKTCAEQAYSQAAAMLEARKQFI